MGRRTHQADALELALHERGIQIRLSDGDLQLRLGVT
jgi:hypothetical protein